MFGIKMKYKGDKQFTKIDLIRPIMIGVDKGLLETTGHIKKNKLSGQLLKVRTGTLRRSIEQRSRARGKKITGTIGSRLPYAKIQEEGGTVRPKKGQYLTIPTQFAKTAAGVVRGGARSFANTFIQRSKRGNLLIFQKTGDGIIPLFLLVKSVRIKPKHYLRKGMTDKIDSIQRHIVREIQRAV
jgi:hypothetical protein